MPNFAQWRRMRTSIRLATLLCSLKDGHQMSLRDSVPLLGRLAIPPRCLNKVLGDTLAFVVHAPEKKLGIGVTLLNQWHKLL